MRLPLWARRLLPAALFALAPGGAGPASAEAGAAAEVRAVFVGIGAYQHGVRNGGPDDIAILDGPVQDVGKMRDALVQNFGFGFAPLPQPGLPCAPLPARATSLSTALLDQCATRDAILAAIAAQIEAARPGATLILYLAGHGRAIEVQRTNDPDSQPGQFHSSFLPWDARDPKIEFDEILDVDFGALRQRATAKGVNVIFIADYCSSGTATRDLGPAGRVRSALPAKIRKNLPPPAQEASGTGRSVLLAATRDGEKAYEQVTGSDQAAGIFTRALIQVMAQHRGASFLDLIQAVRTQPVMLARADQHPRAEGDLTYALTATGLTTPSAPGPVLDATFARGQLSLPRDGDLAGLTVGSIFALFDNATAAGTAGAKPLVVARVAAVEPYAARLEPLGTLPGALPTELFARETLHVAPPLKVKLDAWLTGSPVYAALRDRIVAAMAAPAQAAAAVADNPTAAALPMQLSDDATLILGVNGGCGTLELLDSAGNPIVRLGRFDAGFIARLRAALLRVSRVDQLLARGPGTSGGIALCLDQTLVLACPPDPGRAPLSLRARLGADLVVQNHDAEPLYVYVLAIDEDRTVRMILPAAGGVDGTLPAKALTRTLVPLGKAGYHCRFVAIATDQRLSTAGLITGDAGPGQCGGSIENVSSLRGSEGTTESGPARPLYWAMAIADVDIAGIRREEHECAN